MIRKPPGGRAALWHQDHAYWQPELDYYAALGVWLPMHDVSVEMGAMQFIPGSHKRGLLPHQHGDDRRQRADVDADRHLEGRRLPAEEGRLTFHHYETLHYTAPNTTDQPRYAYPMEFQTRPVRREARSTCPGSTSTAPRRASRTTPSSPRTAASCACRC